MEQDNLQQPEELNVNDNTTPEVTNNETENEISVQGQPTPIEKTTQPEPPVWDFSGFNTDEIITHAKELIDHYPVYQLRSLDSLPQIFEAQYQREYDKALSEYTANGNSLETFDYQNDSKERFYSIYRLYREKKATYYKKSEEEKEENLNIKLQIIEELKQLTQKEESFNKTFQEFRSLQERWRNTGMVPQARVNDLLETYHLHVENFYNYIQINREFRDLDLKKNLENKIILCEEAEKLLEDNNIGDAFKQLQQLHTQWKEIGPVAADQKDVIWDRFKEVSDKINNRYHNFLNSLKEEQINNLKIKEDICEKIEILSQGTYNSHSQWNQVSTQVTELQEEWKRSGIVPPKERNKIFKRYRTACDIFYEKKRTYYQNLQKEQEQNLALKLALCEKVEAIKDSTDWRTTTDQIISYQKEWKKIGPVSKKHSNKVWNRFRGACDYFFNNKSTHVKNITSNQQENLQKKKALIEEVRNFVFGEDNEANIATLKEFQTRWAEIGFVPIKEKDAIQSEFRNLIDAHFDQLDLNDFDKSLEKFKSKVNTFDSSEDKDSKIILEREKLVNKIKLLEADLHVWENNIGFFSKSSNSENLIKDFSIKIEAARHKLSLMYEKLKVIDSMI